MKWMDCLMRFQGSFIGIKQFVGNNLFCNAHSTLLPWRYVWGREEGAEGYSPKINFSLVNQNECNLHTYYMVSLTFSSALSAAILKNDSRPHTTSIVNILTLQKCVYFTLMSLIWIQEVPEYFWMLDWSSVCKQFQRLPWQRGWRQRRKVTADALDSIPYIGVKRPFQKF